MTGCTDTTELTLNDRLTICPDESSRGPPELPALMAASVCMAPLMRVPTGEGLRKPKKHSLACRLDHAKLHLCILHNRSLPCHGTAPHMLRLSPLTMPADSVRVNP